MKVGSTLVVLLVASACATPPPAKLSWTEAAQASTAEVDEDAVAPPDPEGEARMRAASPLAQGTARFDGIEQVLRSRFGGGPMPDDARLAWGGMLALIDHALAPGITSTREDLLRARAATRAALAIDAQAYPMFPRSLDGDARQRLAALSTRLAKDRPTTPTSATLVWPLSPDQVTSLFGSRPDPFDRQTWRLHQGVNLSAPAGTLVVTAGPGMVVDCGWRKGFGLLVTVRHADGTITRYGHLSRVLTQAGLDLRAGDAIGLVGSTGRSTGPHLHFEMWRHGQALDPLIELGDPEVDVPGIAATP